MSLSPMDHPDALRRPLDEALQVEITRLELLIARVWQAVAMLAAVGGAVVYLALDLPMGAWCGVGAMVYFGWFTVEVRLRQRGPVSVALDVANIAVESTMPWAFFVLITFTESAAYALGSWIPPFVFAALLVASTARLRPRVPMIIGIAAGVCLLLAYFAVVRPQLPIALRAEPLYTPFMQVSRALSMIVGGALAMIVASGLRRAFGKADRVARQTDLFGKYQLERRIASGGMGTVYEARYCPEGGFERRVAVKLIHPHLASEPHFVDAFRREAELSALLAHPNVVQVMDFGRAQESYFLAMEYVDGLTLASLMARMRNHAMAFEPCVVAYVAREILAGLAYAHAGARDQSGALLRVVHRDLCPPNVLLSKNGEVKITDFGVARALGDVASLQTRTVVGHTAYMAPEQARAQSVDERGDLFSLGVTLWEMLCGRPLFNRGADGPTLLALVNDAVPRPTSLCDVDPAWDDFLLRATERDQDLRFASALAMAAALDALKDARQPVGTDKLADLLGRVATPESMSREAKSQRLSEPQPGADAHSASSAPTKIV